MLTTEVKDALNNIGLPQFTSYDSIYDFSKNDVKIIKKTIIELDKLSNCTIDKLKTYQTRQTIINLIHNYCVTFRCYSLYID